MEAAARQERGFTLIELLTVVLILGVLAAIAVPVFLNQRDGSWRSTLLSDLRNAAASMEQDAGDLGSYPEEGVATLRSSPDVTVAVVAPPPTGMRYCVTATHVNLPGETFMLDSSEGAIRTGDCT